MMSLPESFGNLTKLQHLDLSRASCLQVLPNSFGDLTRLKYLDLSDCPKLVISSGLFGNITPLQCLDLSQCTNVNELPPLENQLSLEYLDFLGTNFRQWPRRIENLSNLEAISLSGLEALPDSLGYLRSSLRYLWLSNSPTLKCLPVSVSLLKQLTLLEIRKCGIYCLPEDLTRMNNLKMLNVSDCPLRQLPFGRRGERALSNDNFMFGLTVLTLKSIELIEVSFSKGFCPNLQHLGIDSCKYVKEVAALPSTLKSLKVIACDKVMSIKGLAQLTKLRMLHVQQCHELLELPDVQQLTSLEKLVSRGCGKLHKLRNFFDKDEEWEKEECNFFDKDGWMDSIFGKLLNIYYKLS